MNGVVLDGLMEERCVDIVSCDAMWCNVTQRGMAMLLCGYVVWFGMIECFCLLRLTDWLADCVARCCFGLI